MTVRSWIVLLATMAFVAGPVGAHEEGDVPEPVCDTPPGPAPPRSPRADHTRIELLAHVDPDAVDRHGHVRGALDARAIHALARRVATALGLDASEYGAHSLRASYATLAYRSGLPEVEVMRHGGWRSAQVMRRYVREAERWSVNFTRAVGL